MTHGNEKTDKKSASPIWGGRFSGGPSQLMQDINASISYDKTFYRQDIAGSIAHATMLASQNIISVSDKDAIISGLTQIEDEISTGTFTFSAELEDIHMNIETRLVELIGALQSGYIQHVRGMIRLQQICGFGFATVWLIWMRC